MSYNRTKSTALLLAAGAYQLGQCKWHSVRQLYHNLPTYANPLCWLCHRGLSLPSEINEASLSGYTQVPNWVLMSQTISPIAKLVYIVLLSHDWADKETGKRKGYVYPAEDTIATEVNCSVRTVQRALKELAAAGLLRTTRREQDNHGKFRRNTYQLLDVEGHNTGWERSRFSRVQPSSSKRRRRTRTPAMQQDGHTPN